MNCEISLTKTHFSPLFELKSLNRAQQTKLLYRLQWIIYYTHLNNSNICKINYQLRTSDVPSCFMTSSVTTPRSCRSLLRVENASACILLICYFMDSSESNITPRLRTVWAQWMEEEATVREHCSWEILARLDLEPNKMYSVFNGLSCRQSEE